jgi:hypothetical protein
MARGVKFYIFEKSIFCELSDVTNTCPHRRHFENLFSIKIKYFAFKHFFLLITKDNISKANQILHF